MQEAIDLLEAEHHRQIMSRDELFGGGDAQGAKSASDLAWHYRVAVAFLNEKLASLTRKG
jgi:hypothetical protein